MWDMQQITAFYGPRFPHLSAEVFTLGEHRDLLARVFLKGGYQGVRVTTP